MPNTFKIHITNNLLELFVKEDEETTKEYSIDDRSREIKQIIKTKKKVLFNELFDIYSKDYIVVTFLSILDLAKKQELKIEQSKNFDKIFIVG